MLVQAWILSRKSGFAPGSFEYIEKDKADELAARGLVQLSFGMRASDMMQPVPETCDETREQAVMPEDQSSKKQKMVTRRY